MRISSVNLSNVNFKNSQPLRPLTEESKDEKKTEPVTKPVPKPIEEKQVKTDKVVTDKNKNKINFLA